VRQRKLSFYGGRAKHFVNASAGKKNGGLFVERILISTVKTNYEATEGIEIKKYIELIRKCNIYIYGIPIFCSAQFGHFLNKAILFFN